MDEETPGNDPEKAGKPQNQGDSSPGSPLSLKIPRVLGSAGCFSLWNPGIPWKKQGKLMGNDPGVCQGREN